MHPLVNDTAKLSDNELEQKIIDLSRKYWQVHNPQVQAQISMIIEEYKLEQQTRRVRQKQSEQENGNSDLDSLIKVS
jgi:hypothetical protein